MEYDWKEIFTNKKITSGRKLISKFEFNIDQVPNAPTITVYVWEQLNGMYFATTDHKIKNSKQGTPCREENAHSTMEEALRAAINSITMFIEEPYDKIEFPKAEWV